MTAASASPAPPPAAQTRVVGSKVFVRGIQLMAEVGLYAHERGRRQPLILDVELDIGFSGVEHLSDTVNYETIVQAAQSLADEGHVELVELFAERLAQRCLADPRVTRARVRLEKPEALAPHAAGAGVEITLVRG
ncbi:dihydroneopterin aldolase [Phenylobacterium sp.]|uniref:dihydroneopterin aldolase n=1 Tax=Phenylobacterium sp. TaxID=1871053 RepID=UPI00391AE23F